MLLSRAPHLVLDGALLAAAAVGADRVFLIASVDLAGNRTEAELAQRHQELEDRLESYPMIERAMLTLPTPGDQPLVPQAKGPGPQSPA